MYIVRRTCVGVSKLPFVFSTLPQKVKTESLNNSVALNFRVNLANARRTLANSATVDRMLTVSGAAHVQRAGRSYTYRS